jgi:transposase
MRALPADFPPAGTVYRWADKWQADGSAERMHDDLRGRIRLAAGRTAAPTAAIIDSQSVKGSEMIGCGRRGYDAGKKINGTKRHLAVDTIGLLLTVLVTAASVQDRDAARPLLWNLRRAFPSVKLAWADGGYAGKLVTWATTRLRLRLEIVKRPDDLHTFQVLPRRWVVERTLSWITRHRRTVRDYERTAAHHETYIYWAMIHRHDPPPRPRTARAGGQRAAASQRPDAAARGIRRPSSSACRRGSAGSRASGPVLRCVRGLCPGQDLICCHQRFPSSPGCPAAGERRMRRRSGISGSRAGPAAPGGRVSRGP